ncbi:hypothetical protein BDA99DRAFT_49990 [Phascolomyces articulosus]|uniref:Uncharacterized protein n=1 Tax=Phascolomyces articulosus TaxID=60185 RepID=A0AAD5K0V6_9FUNG|nr:hypothetical protein BDA99DRAFT_49990 [Phascolomyces articulosus]
MEAKVGIPMLWVIKEEYVDFIREIKTYTEEYQLYPNMKEYAQEYLGKDVERDPTVDSSTYID